MMSCFWLDQSRLRNIASETPKLLCVFLQKSRGLWSFLLIFILISLRKGPFDHNLGPFCPNSKHLKKAKAVTLLEHGPESGCDGVEE